MKKSIREICSVLFLIFSVFVSRGYAKEPAATVEDQQPAATEEVPSEEAYQFPLIPPSGTVFAGPRIVSLSGSTRADEYEYLHSSVSLGGELRFFSFPNRLHLDIDYKDKKDYFGDVGYAYKDIILFRGINRTLFHNLDDIVLVGPAVGTVPTSVQRVDVRDPGAEYGVRWGMSSAFLRFKTPDYPFHVYLDSSIIDREGTIQQRFLGGAAFFNNIVRTSESRNIDWETKNITVGTNTHLGPVEIDVSHGEKKFDPHGDHVLSDFYNDAGSTRIAGIFPHNLVPDLEGSSNTIRLHTSYTGRLVASATFTKLDRQNNDSGAKADYFIGAGEVSWIPAANVGVFVKYRHKEADIDNPLTDTIDNVCVPSNNPAGTYKCTIEPSVSSISDVISTTVRYRPISLLTLRAEYSYDAIRRENFKEWGLPEKTRHNTGSLSAAMRIMRNLNLNACYTHKEVDDPAYNIEPNHSDEGKATLSWMPVTRLNTFVSYSVAKEKRSDLNFDGNPAAQNRDVNRDRLMGAVTYLMTDRLSLTASYSYIHDKIQQDITFSDTAGNPQFDPFVPDTDLAHNYALSVNYVPNDRIDLNAGLSYTVSSGAFYPTSDDLLLPVSVATFSELKTRETVFSLSGEYRISKDLTAGIQYRYTDFNDVLDNPWDDVQDGRAHIVLLTLSKKW